MSSPIRELDAFARHCMSRDTSSRILVIEGTVAHQELFPSLLYYFKCCGLGVDFLLTERQRESREILPALPETEADGCNFFYILSDASYAVVARILNKHPYGYLLFNTVFEEWLPASLSAFFQSLKNAQKKIFTIGHSWNGMADTMPAYAFARPETTFVLGEHMAEAYRLPLLSASIFPGFPPARRLRAGERVRFASVGGFEEKLRDYQSVIDACVALNEQGLGGGYGVLLMVGCFRENIPALERFVASIEGCKLEDTISVIVTPDYPTLFRELGNCHYLLFLLNSGSYHARSSYMHNRITGSLSLALGFGAVPVLERGFAEAWNFSECCLTHESGELSQAMLNAILAPEIQAEKQEVLIRKNKALTTKSLETIAALVQKPEDPGGACTLETGPNRYP